MKNVPGWIIGILVIVLIAGIFYIGYEKGKQKELKKALENKEQEIVDLIKIKDTELKEKDKEIKELDFQLVAVNERLDSLELAKDGWKEEAEKWKKKAEEAQPEELVKDIREILDTDEIWPVENGILFSMDAFRKVTAKMYEWKDFYMVREPNYKQTIETYKLKVYLLTSKVENLEEQVIMLKDIRTYQEEWNEQLKEYIVKRDKKDFWNTVKQVGVGIAIGTSMVLIFGE